MHVSIPPPFDFELSVERYRTFSPDPANLWDEGVLYRAFDGLEAAISAAPGGVQVEPADAALVEPVRRFLGASFDLRAFAAFAAEDPTLATLVRRFRGFRPSLVPDPFEMLVSSVTAQQVSLRAALAIRTRLVERFGRRTGRAYAFPTRGVLARASAGELRELGFSSRKAEYVLGFARSDVDFDALAHRSDDEIRERLTALPGIGEWTVDWFLARHVGRPDAWPAGDLGLRKALAARYLDGRDVSVAETRAFGERFSPHRNLAAQYLLLSLRA